MYVLTFTISFARWCHIASAGP